MPTYGLTSAGFIAKPRDTIKLELENAFRSAYGTSIDVSPASSFGQEIAVYTEQEGIAWDQMAALYDSGFANSAEGINLLRVCGLTGCYQKPATFSEVVVQCTGTNGTVIPAGTIFSTADGLVRVITKASATINPGTYVDVDCSSTVTGPVIYGVGTLTTIETPVSGLTSVTNLEAGYIIGTVLENDPTIRSRRAASLRQGRGSAASIRAAVLACRNVVDCQVYVNQTGGIVDGVEPYSFETVVNGGTSADIAAAIEYHKGATTPTCGNQAVVNVTESDGTHPIYFSRPTEVPVYLQARVWAISTQQQPDNFEALCAAALVQTFQVGKDIHCSQMVSRLMAVDSSIVSVEYVVASRTALAEPIPRDTGSHAGSTDLSIAIREIATVDVANIQVIVRQVTE